MSDTPNQTVIADDAEFDGTLTSRGPVSLRGTLKGKLSAPRLEVAPGGSVQGDVKVKELSSEGEVSGNIEADAVRLAGRVSDQTVISATTLEVKLGDGGQGALQVTFGNCELNVGEKSAKKSTGHGKASKAEPKSQEAPEAELTT